MIRKLCIGTQTGYLYCELAKQGQIRKNRTVHSLVAEAFIGPRPPGCEVAHKDGSRTNNFLSNLRYATYSENNADKLQHGTHLVGGKAPGAKLTNNDVDDIWFLISLKVKLGDIAKMLRISPGQISEIRAGNQWKNYGIVSLSPTVK